MRVSFWHPLCRLLCCAWSCYLFPFLFLIVPRLLPFWVKERFWGSSFGRPHFCFFISGLTFPLRPSRYFAEISFGAEADSVSFFYLILLLSWGFAVLRLFAHTYWRVDPFLYKRATPAGSQSPLFCQYATKAHNALLGAKTPLSIKTRYFLSSPRKAPNHLWQLGILGD